MSEATLPRTEAKPVLSGGAMVWLLLSAVIVFLCNLLFAYRDVMLIRLETPKKVLDETVDVEAEEAILIDPLAPDS